MIFCWIGGFEKNQFELKVSVHTINKKYNKKNQQRHLTSVTDTVSAKSLCCGMGVVSDINYVTGENLTELNNKTGKTTLQPLPNLSYITNQLEGKYSELISSTEYEKLRLPQPHYLYHEAKNEKHRYES